MKKWIFLSSFILMIFFLPVTWVFAATSTNQIIYDHADLLTEADKTELESIARSVADKRETDFILLTTNNTDGKTIERYTEDFYDETGPGYDKKHGNTAILTIDMGNREVYLSGFYKADEYLDSERLDLIRNKITPYLTNGDYGNAYRIFIETADEYMDYRPGVNPENILFKLWFQVVASIALGVIIVGLMAMNIGGKITVNQRTYMDPNKSRVVQKGDTYIRTTVSKRRKPSENNSRGGGGGGISRGGHSHSGSKGSF